jgi:hypothetical protein
MRFQDFPDTSTAVVRSGIRRAHQRRGKAAFGSLAHAFRQEMLDRQPIADSLAASYVTVSPLENSEVSPAASVRVAVMSGFAPVTVVVTVKVKFCVPVLVGVIVNEPR